MNDLDQNVYALFARHAAATPDAVAIVQPDGSTTSYGELAEMACRVEQFLHARGLQPEAPVGVLMERTPATIAVLLGILKAGGAYVPIELHDPARRQLSIVRRADVELVIHDHAVADGLRAQVRDAALPRPVAFVTTSEVLTAEPGPAGRCAPGLHRLAYILFTSGSTGEPKGVEIEHRSVVNLLLAAADLIEFSADDCYLAAATIAFDISVAEIFMPLIFGARFLLRDRSIWLDPAQLAADITTRGVSVVQTAPSTWAVVLGADVGLPRFRVAIANAEALPPDLAPVLVDTAELAWNFYGPTETTIWSTAFRLTHETIRPTSYTEAAMSIGQPMANQGARVITADGRREVTGQRGELHISGLGLARGYRNDPELTAQRFVTFADSPKRFYATGDECGWSIDSDLLFYGRVDDQMKVRGNRVDPAEVEAVINEHVAVRRSAVTWYEAAGGRGIVAATQVQRGAGLTAVQLHRWLEARLPTAMLPSRYLFLDELPLSPNGKLDRGAIRGIADGAIEPDPATAVELTDAQAAAAAAWRTVLAVDALHPDDHFFMIGGDSLAVVMVLGQIETMYGVVLPVTALFEAPTLDEFAAVLDAARTAASGEHASRDAGRRSLRTSAPGLVRRLLRRPSSAASAAPPSPSPGRDAIGVRTRPAPELPEPFDPSEDVIARLRGYVAPWQGKRLHADSLIVSLNEHGTRTPLFWCCQGAHEMMMLAAHLGPDQPLHGMRSGHLMIDHHDPSSRRPIVERYVEEMLEVQPDGAFQMGGNCQAALIMQEAATRLQARGREIGLLVIMEQSLIRPFDGPVALLYGKRSHLNPFTDPDADPHATFRANFPAGYRVAEIEGAHGQFFDHPNIETLAATLTSLISTTGPE